MIIISESRPIKVAGNIPGLQEFKDLSGAAQLRGENPVDNFLVAADGEKKTLNELATGPCPSKPKKVMKTIAIYENYGDLDPQLQGNVPDNQFSFAFADGGDEFVSEAIGRKTKKRGGFLADYKARKNEKLAIRKMKVKGTADAKNLKAQAKVLSAKAQQAAAKNIGKEDPAIAALANQTNIEAPAPSSGMSPTTKKWLIGGGIGLVVIIIGVVGYKIYKKRKGK